MALTNVHPKSFTASAGTNALHDIKPPVEIPSGWAWVGWVLVALAVAALAFWAWRYWQKRRAQVPQIPVIPAHIRAKQKLREALALIGQPREFCIIGLRYRPLVSGGAVRLPCARAHHRGVPL